MRTIIYVVVNKDNLIYGVTKDFATAIEATEKFEEAYGERNWSIARGLQSMLRAVVRTLKENNSA